MRNRPLIAGLVAAAVVVVVIAVALAMPRALGGPSHRVSIRFPVASTGLVAGSDVLEAGAKVGSVASIEPTADNHAWVVIQVADPHWPLHRGVSAGIRPRGLFGEKYVDVHDGPSTAPAYDPATPLQSTQSEVPVELDSFLASLDDPTRSALRVLLNDLGGGVAGTGPDLNQAIAAARSDLENLATTGRTLNHRDPDLDRILVGLDGVLGKITQNDQLTQLSQLISNGQQTLDAVEAEQGSFSRQFVDAQAVLGDLNTAIDPAVADLRDLVTLAPHLIGQLQTESGLLAQLGSTFDASTLQTFEQSLLHGPTTTGGALEQVPPGSNPLGTGLPIFRICVATTSTSCTGNGYQPTPTQSPFPGSTGGGELLTLAGFIGA